MIERAEELKGKNGKIFGTSKYMEDLNIKHYIYGSVTNKADDTRYYAAFKNCRESAKKAIDEIYMDLENNIDIIHFLSDNDRKEMEKFLIGLNGLILITDSMHLNVNKAVKILKLSDGKTGYQSNAKEKSILNAAKAVKSGSLSKFGLSASLSILGKAAKYGSKRAAGGDREKLSFLSAVLGENKDCKEYYGDVLNAYNSIYKKTSYKGKCGRELCSKEYISYVENTIFSGTGFKKYMKKQYDYRTFFINRLKGIAKDIYIDAGNGTVGKSYIKEDNIKFLDNEVIPNLIDCRITPPDYKKAAKDFIMPDVTEKLFEIMRKAEADGREIALENPGIKNYIDKLLAFMSSVGAGNDYDLKAKEDWNSSWYYFDGYVLRFDDPGNIAYGIILKETFKGSPEKSEIPWYENIFLETFGHLGAGGAQWLDNYFKPVLDNLGKFLFFREIKYTSYIIDDLYDKKVAEKLVIEFGKDVFEIYKSLATLISNWKTLFDDPRDYEAIELGYDYYDNKRYH